MARFVTTMLFVLSCAGCATDSCHNGACPLEAYVEPPVESIPHDSDSQVLMPGDQPPNLQHQIQELEASLQEGESRLRQATGDYQKLLNEHTVALARIDELNEQQTRLNETVESQGSRLSEQASQLSQRESQLATMSTQLAAERRTAEGLRDALLETRQEHKREYAETLKMLDELIQKHETTTVSE